LARHFDEVFRRLDLTNGQFSLLMALNRPVPPTVGDLASFLAMDRTTLPALIKPLERRGLLAVSTDAQDRRKRRVCLTTAGHRILQQAYPLWCEAHAALEGQISNAAGLRAHLVQLSTLAEASRAQGRAPEA
jgi:DNA-binding MarR family transcriptional regulator